MFSPNDKKGGKKLENVDAFAFWNRGEPNIGEGIEEFDHGFVFVEFVAGRNVATFTCNGWIKTLELGKTCLFVDMGFIPVYYSIIVIVDRSCVIGTFEELVGPFEDTSEQGQGRGIEKHDTHQENPDQSLSGQY